MRDLEPLRELSTFQLLAELLPERVGSLLSLNALRQDLEVSHRALTHWMEVLELIDRVRRLAVPVLVLGVVSPGGLHDEDVRREGPPRGPQEHLARADARD